jgi:hypothetical protein
MTNIVQTAGAVAVGSSAVLGVWLIFWWFRAKHSKDKSRYVTKSATPKYSITVCRDGWMAWKKELSPAQMDVIKTIATKHAALLKLSLDDLKKPVSHGVAERELPSGCNVAADKHSADVQGDASLSNPICPVGHPGADLNNHLENRVVIDGIAHTPNVELRDGVGSRLSQPKETPNEK